MIVILIILLIICYFIVLEMRHKHFLKTVKVGDKVKYYGDRLNLNINGEEKFRGEINRISYFSKKLNKIVDYRIFYINSMWNIDDSIISSNSIEKNEGEIYPVLYYKYGN